MADGGWFLWHFPLPPETIKKSPFLYPNILLFLNACVLIWKKPNKNKVISLLCNKNYTNKRNILSLFALSLLALLFYNKMDKQKYFMNIQLRVH